MDDDEQRCPCCGELLDAHHRNVQFRLPDPVLAWPDREQAPGTWMSADAPEDAELMVVPDLGAFVRCLLVVRFEGGATMTYGVWMGVSQETFTRAFESWWAPHYQDLVLDGLLANALPNWDGFRAPVTARVYDAKEKPRIDHSADEALAQVLEQEWPHSMLDTAS